VIVPLSSFTDYPVVLEVEDQAPRALAILVPASNPSGKACSAGANKGACMATFFVVHGAWSAGWAWKKMPGPLRERGHAIVTPTCTGLGERAHLARRAIDLETHIEDMLGVLEFEDLRDVILVGHSYGGMVATGVAGRVPERIAQLVYLDAFVPQAGQCLFDLVSPEVSRTMRRLAAETGEGWQVPPNPMPPDTPEADLAWAVPRRRPQPIGTFAARLDLRGEPSIPRTYIYCTRAASGDTFRPFAERARRESDWRCFEIDASHNPHITAPEALADLLDRIAAG
jgi:pimeloyl-ACP methyl ester carboxylesterase